MANKEEVAKRLNIIFEEGKKVRCEGIDTIEQLEIPHKYADDYINAAKRTIDTLHAQSLSALSRTNEHTSDVDQYGPLH